MKVLVTDHNLDSFGRLYEALEAWNCEVRVAPDRAAIWHTLMLDDDPIIAIIDCEAPGLDGLDALRNIRATVKHRRIYLALLTSRTDTAYLTEALEAGANTYLARPIADADLRICVENGSRLLELEDALSASSTCDALTGLHNRAAIVEQLKKESMRCQRDNSALSIVYTDLDRLQQINQRHGHLIGDAVLRQVAQRLRSALRPYDHLGRLGGDEMLMILPACNTAGALEVAERARMAVATVPVNYQGEEVLASITSVAATMHGRKKMGPDTLLQMAETAMYRAKEKGRNQVGLANTYCSIL